MAEFLLGRIKFVYQGDWNNSGAYVVDDVVTVGGKTYICVVNHTASTFFATDLNNPVPRWNIVADGQTWRDVWTTNTYYDAGDLVRYYGIVYQCNTPHSSNVSANAPYGLEADLAKWDLFANSFNWRGEWTINTYFHTGDIVSYGGYVYYCTTSHESAATVADGLEVDDSNWDIFNAGLTYLGPWATGQRYRINDVVQKGADIWICVTPHTAGASINTTNFEILVNGLEFINSWDSVTEYIVGDLATYGGYTYVAKQNNSNKTPYTEPTFWTPFTTGFNFSGDWQLGTAYQIGDVVRLHGYTYVATADSTGQIPPNVVYWQKLNSGVYWTNNVATYTNVVTEHVTVNSAFATGAAYTVVLSNTVYTLTRTANGSDYTTGDVIKILGTSIGGISPANDVTITVTASAGSITSQTWIGISVTWGTGVTYVLGDVVFYGVNSYICVQNHIAANGNKPDADTIGAYWNMLAAGAESATLTTPGDLVYQGINGAVRLPIGTNGQILRSTEGYPVWSNYGLINNVVYVGPSGADIPAPNNGLTIDTPWKTVQYACQQIEDGYQNPNAKTLLRINKQFLINEVSNYVDYVYRASVSSTSSGAFITTNTLGLTLGMPVKFTGQTGSLTLDGSLISANTTYYIKTITANTSFTVSGTYNGTVLAGAGTGTAIVKFAPATPESIQRDAGYIVDALVFDLSHGGTLKTTTVTRAYYNAAGTDYVNALVSYEIPQFTGALSYLRQLATSVLANSPPAANYQALNGINSGDRAQQQINASYAAELVATSITQGLMSIVITGIEAGSTTGIAVVLNPNTTISIKTGTYNEILPIVLPSNTALVGDELRSTVIQPSAANPLLSTYSAKNISVLTRIKSLISDLVANTTITPTAGNTAIQIKTLPPGNVGSATAVTRVISNCNTLYSIVDTGIGSLPAFVMPAPTGYNTSFLAGYGDGKAQIVQNYAFIKDEVSNYLNTNFNAIWAALGAGGQATCQRDIGYILDAIQYDMTYGGNTQTLIAGSSYYQYYSLTIDLTEKAATIAAYTWLKGFIDNIVIANTAGWTKNSSLSQVTTGVAGSAGAATFVQARVQDVIDWITNGIAPSATFPSLTAAGVSTELQAAFTAVQLAKSQIQLDATAWVQKYYQSLTFNIETCSRDVGYIVDALSYDVAFGSNFATIKAGMSYYRGTASAQVVINAQKSAQLGMINFILSKVKTVAASGAVVHARELIDDILNYLAGTGNISSNFIEMNGQVAYNNSLLTVNGAEILRANINFLKHEGTAWIDANYGATVNSTNGSTEVIQCATPHNFVAGDPVVFVSTGNAASTNIVAGQTYYVLASGLTGTDFKITDHVGSTTPLNIITVSSPLLNVKYSYDLTFVQYSITHIINAIVYDLQYTGNYKSIRYTETLKNEINGSITSNMFLVRNGTGVRNMTVSGLTGTLSAVNAYGTKRPTAGAYVSLDPGFGPWDTNAWVTNKSCYVQNVTTFGTGCIGAKIDGGLHAGGNRSIVANDFTQVLSDGIGVWCTGANSLTELVSVFSYYAYTGYLADLGGRIRATNGNSSYGVYGVIAEGTDSYEAPISCILNNRASEALVSTVITDGTNKVLRLEYSNAGSNYTNAAFIINGSGFQAAATGDEFRDRGTFEIRLIDGNDGNNFGGSGYLTAANAAQLSTIGTITIAAADIQLSAAYVGMRITITAGTGVGQTAQILNYTNANKVATIAKESFTTLTITESTAGGNNLLTVASTATLYIGMPLYIGIPVAGLTPNTVYYVISTNFSGTQFAVSTELNGSSATTTATTSTPAVMAAATISGATLTVGTLSSGTVYVGMLVTGTNVQPNTYIVANISGSGAGSTWTISQSQTVISTTITGTVAAPVYAAGFDHLVPGTPITNALDLTTAYLIEPKITATSPGYTATARSLIGTTAWQKTTYGAGNFVAITASGTTTSYSTDGKTWSAGGVLPVSTTWTDVVYGGGQGATATALVGGLGGIGAQLTAVVGTGLFATQVISVEVNSGGAGYLTPPTIVFTGAGGSGASAICTVLNGAIQSVNMIINGSGYTSAPTTTANTSIVSSFPISTSGTNYTSSPNVVVGDPFTGTLWTDSGPAVLNAYYYYINGSTKNWYQAGATGTFSNIAPTFSTGTGASGTYGVALSYVGTTAGGTANLSNFGVNTITVSQPGYGYTETPSVTIVDATAKFVAIAAGGTSTAFQEADSLSLAWTAGNPLPTNNFASVAFGNATWVAVGGTNGSTASAASSTDGETWTTRAITSLSTLGSYSSVTFGNGIFVAIPTGNSVTSYSNNGISWVAGGLLPAQTTWTSIAYGVNRFVALATTGQISYSLDLGVTWNSEPTTTGTTASILSSSLTWTEISYGQGLFYAVANGTIAATSPDGINWTLRTMPGSSTNWNSVVFGNPSNIPTWVAISKTSGTISASIATGATTQARIRSASGQLAEIRTVEPGSGYPAGVISAVTTSTNVLTTSDTTNLIDSQPVEFTGLDSYGLATNITYYIIGSSIVTNTSFKVSATSGSATAVIISATASDLAGKYRTGPILTQVDPNKIITAKTRVRTSDGVVANPSFSNRGTLNATATATIQGDGAADVYQPSTFISISNLFTVPTAGANITFSSIPGSYYKLVQTTNLQGIPGNYTAQFQINPSLTVLNAPAYGDIITTTLKYSQVRLTGHDFLYIGTGNFNQTNYPFVDTGTAITSNQEYETAGGRVFFTSTDQDGNFNVGNLFGVQQATGTATLNATAFNLAGLQSLQLGSVTIGTNSAVITQFSTDPYFTANSDAILPTQKAIKAYITSQIGGGQSNINVNTLTSGVIYVSNNTITTTSGIQIKVTSKMYFTGGIDGAAMAVPFFMQR